MFGKSRQAYYKWLHKVENKYLEIEIILQLVEQARKRKRRTGVRKLYKELKEKFTEQGIKIGRDALFDILRDHGLLVKKRRNRVITTQSFHWLRKYPNLIKELVPTGSNQIWVSDITYIKTKEGFMYLYLISDAYSRKIVGWNVSDDLTANSAVIALKLAMAAEKPPEKIIHHSDRGIQYCSHEYVGLLKKNQFRISMTEHGDPLENAIAERINGILKDEWINDIKLMGKKDAYNNLQWIVEVYNMERLHTSIDYMTPTEAHLNQGEIKRRWKSYYKQHEKHLQET